MYLDGIETERLVFRKIEKNDALGWETYFKDNPNLKYLGIDLTMSIKAQAENWINIQLKRYKDKRYGLHTLIEKETGKYIGQCGLLEQTINGKKEIEIGYHLIPAFWGKGFATEAAKKCRDFAFENKLTERLISVIDKRNIASQNVARKNGMIISESAKLFGLDVFIFRINKADWLTSKRILV